jgi:threonine dehydrogenase-like Zn-dependent dehydrogenase
VACLGYVKQDFRDVIDAIATGNMSPGDMITSKISLENVVDDGIKELLKNKERHVKVLVEI